MYISTANVDTYLRPLTSLFLDALFTLPLQTKDGLIPYEEIVKRLSEDTVDYHASLGTSVGFREVATIGLKVEVSPCPCFSFYLSEMYALKSAHSSIFPVGCQIRNCHPVDQGCSMEH